MINNAMDTEEKKEKTDLIDQVQEKVERDGLGKTVVDGLGKAAAYPAGVAGNLMTNMNAVNASQNPGKALGQSMLIGMAAFLASMVLGNGILSSLGLGLGCGIMGQEIKTVSSNVLDGISGKEPVGGRKFLTSAIPLLLSMVLSSKLGVSKAIFTTVLGGAVGSRVSNMFMGSNLQERYYGEEYVKEPPVSEFKEKNELQAKDLEKGLSARPDIVLEERLEAGDKQSRETKSEPCVARNSINRANQPVAGQTEQSHNSRNSIKF